MRKFSNTRVLLTLLTVLAPLSSMAKDKVVPKNKAIGSKTWRLMLQPERVVNGSPLAFRVIAPATLESLSGKWLDHDIYFFFDPKTRTWNGLGGVALSTRPGVYPLELTGTTKQHKAVSYQRAVRVRAGKYRSILLDVAAKYTAPSPEQQEVIKRDREIKQETFAKVTPEREWDGSFRFPLQAPISDTFGTTRTFNGEVKSVHEGLDFGAKAGAPVAALNAGTVLLARPLYFEGNCVVLDHGQGLLTLYLHLSEFRVKEGDVVKRGQEIGLVGGTGRATGPHLHVAVRWQGVYLDPDTLLKLKLP
jgi:murein DD-endopeptidase MepM/ murein hydrolase activator NlpD